MAESHSSNKRRTKPLPSQAHITNVQSPPLDTEIQNVLLRAAKGEFVGSEIAAGTKNDSELIAGIRAMQETIQVQQQEIDDLRSQLNTTTNNHNRALEEAQALTHLGSWEWDISSDTISWSDELYRIYGMKPQERAIGFTEFIDLIHPEDRSGVQNIIQEAFQTGLPFEFEHRIILPSQNIRILRGMGKTITDENHKPLRMLGTSQDITHAKQLDRAKDEFLSLVSHQLRTPLTIIRIHGNILEDGIAGPLDPAQETHIRTMTTASVRLIGLVDDILSISRLSLDRIKVSTQSTDPNALIQSCLEEVEPFRQSKDVTISFTPDTTLGTVPIDTVIFGEVLRNLVTNAIRYSSDNKPRIEISFTKTDDEYLLQVSDNGIGIPESEQAFVFDRFYRAHNATVADSEGSGLGLYIVKLFIEAVGGSVRFESEEGKGTTLFVTFPGRGMAAQK
jgi:PAS domain S-box-containing protein